MALFDPLSNAFGLDIGDRTFKLVQFSKRRYGAARYRLCAWGSVDVAEGVMEKGEIKDMDKAVEAIGRLLNTADGKLSGRATVACLPEAKTFIKIIEIKRGASEPVLRKALISEIEQNIPLPLEEIYFDWQVLDADQPAEEDEGSSDPKDQAEAEKQADEKTDAPVGKDRVLLGAAPKKLVNDYTALLEKAGLAPVALEIEATALSRAIIPEKENIDEAVGILDIGATRSSLVIYDRGALQISISIPISGMAITKLISGSLDISINDAELLKRECGLDANRCEDKMWKILLPLIDDMTEKVRNALRFYKIGFPDGKKIERLYLCGGGAQFHEIDTVLSRKLTIKVRRGDALSNLDPKQPPAFPKDNALMYATAIGLGIRAADESEKYRSMFT